MSTKDAKYILDNKEMYSDNEVAEAMGILGVQ